MEDQEILSARAWLNRWCSMVEKLLGARLFENKENGSPPWTTWLSQIQCK